MWIHVRLEACDRGRDILLGLIISGQLGFRREGVFGEVEQGDRILGLPFPFRLGLRRFQPDTIDAILLQTNRFKMLHIVIASVVEVDAVCGCLSDV